MVNKRIERSVEVPLALKLFLFFDSFRFLPFDILKGFRMVISDLPEKVDKRIDRFLWDHAEIVRNFIVSNPISQIAFLLPFVHFGQILLDLHSPAFSDCHHHLLNIWLEHIKVDLLQEFRSNLFLLCQELTHGACYIAARRFGCIVLDGEILHLLGQLIDRQDPRTLHVLEKNYISNF